MNPKLDMVAHFHAPRTQYAEEGENQNKKKKRNRLQLVTSENRQFLVSCAELM